MVICLLKTYCTSCLYLFMESFFYYLLQYTCHTEAFHTCLVISDYLLMFKMKALKNLLEDLYEKTSL